MTSPADQRTAEVLAIAREWYERVVAHGFPGVDVDAHPCLRAAVRTAIQQLLRCDFATGTVPIGPRAAASIARRDAWVRDAVVNSAFPVVRITAAERRAGHGRRNLTNPVPCPDCDREQRTCTHTFDITVPPGTRPGALLTGRSTASSRTAHVVVDRRVWSPRPVPFVLGLAAAPVIGALLAPGAGLPALTGAGAGLAVAAVVAGTTLLRRVPRP